MHARTYRLPVAFSFLAVLFGIALAPPPVLPADDAPAIWVAPLEDGAHVLDAWQLGAEVLDRLPGALVIDDATSSQTLRDAGWTVYGPISIEPATTVTLVGPRSREVRAPDPAQFAGLPGCRVLYTDGVVAIIESASGANFDALLPELQAKALRSEALRRPQGPAPAFAGESTVFPPQVATMVSEVDPQDYIQWIGNLAGATTVWVGGNPVLFQTRHTATLQCDLAEQYVYEQFLAMGYTDVEYDPFSFQGIQARNVVATLPGLESPEHIYILCGHLDSTSPTYSALAPGANDNASGTAAVLVAAEIMKNYQFRSTIKFIAFTGEEQGLYGSEHYAQQAALNGDQIMGVVNCDMIAWYDQLYQIDIEGEPPWDWLMQIMNDACAEYSGLATDLVYWSWGSDHVPFQNEGFPAFLAIESEYPSYPCYHQTCDTTDQNDATFGADVTRACMATVAYCAEPIAPTTVLAGAPSGVGIELLGSRPNPFNPFTTIRFSLPERQHVELEIHDTGGRLVRTLVQGTVERGEHDVVWDGKSDAGAPCASGVYFHTLKAGETALGGKLVLSR